MRLPTSVYGRKSKRIPHSLGFSSYALDFNGVNQFVNVLAAPSLDIPAITILCYVYWRGGATRRIISKYLAAPNRTFEVYVSALGFINWRTSWNGVVMEDDICTNAINLNRWTHIAAIKEPGGNKYFYINGELDPTFPLLYNPGLNTNASDLTVGIYTDKVSHPFDGLLDIPLVYNRAFSAEEVRYDMLNYHRPIRDGLVLWLPFEEGTGLVAYDRSPHGNNGTLQPAVGPPTWTRVRQYELRAEAGL